MQVLNPATYEKLTQYYKECAKQGVEPDFESVERIMLSEFLFTCNDLAAHLIKEFSSLLTDPDTKDKDSFIKAKAVDDALTKTAPSIIESGTKRFVINCTRKNSDDKPA